MTYNLFLFLFEIIFKKYNIYLNKYRLLYNFNTTVLMKNKKSIFGFKTKIEKNKNLQKNNCTCIETFLY